MYGRSKNSHSQLPAPGRIPTPKLPSGWTWPGRVSERESTASGMVTGRSVFDCSLRHLATGHGEAVPVLLIQAWPAGVASFRLSPGAKKTSKRILGEEVVSGPRA